MNQLQIFEQMASLCQKGYSLYESVNILYTLTKNPILEKMQQQFYQGDSFERIISSLDIDTLWKEYFLFFVQGQSIERSLTLSCHILNVKNDLIQMLKKKMTYPLFLILFSFFFSIFLITFIFPQFQRLYEEFHLQVSLIHRILISLMKIIPIFLLILFLGITVLWIYVYRCIKKRDHQKIRYFMTLPFLSAIMKKYYSIKFAFYYDEFIQSGIDTYHIFQFMKKSLRESDFGFIIYDFDHGFKQGKQFLDMIQESIYFEDQLKLFLSLIFYQEKAFALKTYIDFSLEQFYSWVRQGCQYLTIFAYTFTGVFTVVVYLSLIMPMMNLMDQF